MDLIGNNETKSELKIALDASKKMNKALPHMLFAGAAGCGKTSMAKYVAELADFPFLSVVPKNMKTYEIVLDTLEKLNHDNYDSKGNRIAEIKPTIIFFDEVHNLPLIGQELFGLAMERFKMESGEPNKYYWVPFFTLIGATTKAGSLSKPFLDRFKMKFTFQPYDLEDLTEIVSLHSKKLNLKITLSAVKKIAERSRGTPRIAVSYLERVRNYALSNNSIIITKYLVEEVFTNIGIDKEGLSKVELKLLKALYDNGPSGLETLSIIAEEDKVSVQDYIEPYLVRKGFIIRSGKGRVITKKGIDYISSSDEKKFVKEKIDYNYERK